MVTPTTCALIEKEGCFLVQMYFDLDNPDICKAYANSKSSLSIVARSQVLSSLGVYAVLKAAHNE